MEKVFTQEILRMLSIAGVAGIGLMTLTGRWISGLRGSFQPYLKATILYILVFVLLFGIVGLIGYSDVFKRPGFIYIILQVICTVIGVLHLRYMPRYLKWSGPEKMFWVEVLFTTVVALFGLMAFVIVFKWMNREGYHFLMASSVVWLLIVKFVYHSFKKAVAIPVKLYNQWYYPLHTEVAEPDEEKLKHMLIISFMFQKKPGDEHFTNFRAKAPVDMEFGQLFYYFINDYNERHPASPIAYVNEAGQAYGWTFFRKPKWWEFSTRYVDDRQTFFANKIKENDVIICTRV